MDFVVGLPKSPGEQDVRWLIFYRLTKSAHFCHQDYRFSGQVSRNVCVGDCETIWSACFHCVRL
jgi:hypothetical protein